MRSLGLREDLLACALGIATYNSFLSARYARLPEMPDELCVRKDEEWAKPKKRYVRCDVLILDDWLLELLSREQAKEVLELVEARYRTGSLVLCSQYARRAGATAWVRRGRPPRRWSTASCTARR